jgi:hypothetical protein
MREGEGTRERERRGARGKNAGAREGENAEAREGLGADDEHGTPSTLSAIGVGAGVTIVGGQVLGVRRPIEGVLRVSNVLGDKEMAHTYSWPDHARAHQVELPSSVLCMEAREGLGCR